jgi:exopolysaccharide biosynthesis protein
MGAKDNVLAGVLATALIGVGAAIYSGITASKEGDGESHGGQRASSSGSAPDAGLEARVDAGPGTQEIVTDIPERFTRFDSYAYYPSARDPTITYIHRTLDLPLRMDIVEVDLQRTLVAVNRSPRGATVSDVGARNGDVVVAVNGDHYCPLALKQVQYSPGRCPRGFLPTGISVSNGVQWQGTHDYGINAYVAIGQDGRIEFHREADDILELDDLKARLGDRVNVISGAPMLLYNGEVTDETRSYHNQDTRMARAAVGVSEDMKTLYIVTVDADGSRYSWGMRLPEFAETLRDMGVYHAMGLSDGRSVSLYVRFSGGLVNRPSQGGEEETANHLIVMGR